MSKSLFSQPPKLILPTGHRSAIATSCFSPDGKRIITVSQDGITKIWETKSGYLLASLPSLVEGYELYYFPRISFCRDGSKVMIVWTSSDTSLGNIITIWDNQRMSLLFKKKIIGRLDLFGFSSWHGLESVGKLLSSNGNIFVVKKDSGGIDSIIVINTKNNKIVIRLAKKYYRRVELAPSGNYLITNDNTNETKIWDIRKGILLHTLHGHNSFISDIDLSKDEKTVITSDYDGSIIIWDILSGKKINLLKRSGQRLTRLTISPKGSFFASLEEEDSSIYIWNPVSLKLVNKIHYDGRTTDIFSFVNSDSLFLLTTIEKNSKTGYVELINLRSGKQFPSCKISEYEAGEVETRFSANWEKLIIFQRKLLGKSPILEWDYKNGALNHLMDWNGPTYSPNFSPDSKKILIYTNSGIENENQNIKLVDIHSGNQIQTFTGYIPKEFNFDFYPDTATIAIQIRDSSYKDNFEGRIVLTNLKTLDPYNNKVDSINWAYYFSEISERKPISRGSFKIINNDGRSLKIFDSNTDLYISELPGSYQFAKNIQNKLLALSTENIFSIWDLPACRLACNFIVLSNGDIITLTTEKYYKSSPTAAKILHYVTKDLKVISFEQLDVKYNRPDKVLEAIGNTDTALIKSYRKAWEKRIRKLGIDTTAFRDGYSVPECDFVNRDSVEYEQKSGSLTLRIRGIDSTYKLDRFNVWVNESPLFGQRGISLKTCLPVGREKCNSIDTTITIQLSQGENRIECSITNVNGTESYRMPLYVSYTPAVKQKEAVRFIGIGIDKFKESNYNLQYSSKDIRDLALKLKEKYKDNISIDTLFNENVTVFNVKALKQKLMETSVNDKVIVSYSGHGLLSKDYDYYLSTYSVNFNKPEENGLPYDELENLVDSIPARKKLMLIDACHSGEVDKEEGIAQNRTADSLGLKKGIIIESTRTGSNLGLKSSFELMQSLFVNVGKSTGATIIAAAAGNQYALEGVNKLPNGIFTYCLLEAIAKNDRIKVNDLKNQVSQRVEEITKGLQKPTSRKENNIINWSLW